MSSFAKLYASMESEETGVTSEVTTDDVVEAQEATEEVANAEGEAAEVQDAIEEGAQDAETLETVADTLEETIEDGGADPATAQMAEVAVESIYRRLGIEKKAMPALESFNDKEQRIRATKLAIEDIRETASKIWETIVNFFKSLWAALGRMWQHLVNLFRNNVKVINNLIAEVNKVTEVEKELKGGAINKFLADFYGVKDNSINDAISRIKSLTSKYSDLENFVDKGLDDINKIADLMIEMASKDGNYEEKTTVEKINGFFDEFGKTLLSYGDVSVDKSLADKLDTKDVKAIKGTIVGNRGIVVFASIGENFATISEAKKKKMGASFENDFNKKEERSVKVTKREVLDLLNFTRDFIQTVEKMNVSAYLKPLDNAIKYNKAKFDKLNTSGISQKIEKMFVGQVLKLFMAVINGTIKSMMSSQALLPNAAINVAKQFKSSSKVEDN